MQAAEDSLDEALHAAAALRARWDTEETHLRRSEAETAVQLYTVTGVLWWELTHLEGLAKGL